MKKSLLLLIVSLVSITSISSVNALETNDTITNQSGVVIPVDKYNALKSIYSDNFVNYITQEEYNIIKDNDLSKVEIKEVVDKTSDNKTIGSRAQEHTTPAKSLRIINNNGFVTMTLTWLQVPKIKKYDVMAFRKNTSVNMADFYFFKQYYQSGSNLILSTDKEGLNFDNGVGATFKVQNGTDHEMELSMQFSGTGRVYGSYQHASNSKATLADAMNYTLSGSGYGGVILFDSSIESKFDGMGGVYLTL